MNLDLQAFVEQNTLRYVLYLPGSIKSCEVCRDGPVPLSLRSTTPLEVHSSQFIRYSLSGEYSCPPFENRDVYSASALAEKCSIISSRSAAINYQHAKNLRSRRRDVPSAPHKKTRFRARRCIHISRIYSTRYRKSTAAILVNRPIRTDALTVGESALIKRPRSPYVSKR